jgi:hypothetical protein
MKPSSAIAPMMLPLRILTMPFAPFAMMSVIEATVPARRLSPGASNTNLTFWPTLKLDVSMRRDYIGGLIGVQYRSATARTISTASRPID